MGFAKFHENCFRIDWLDTEKLTFILDNSPLSDRLTLNTASKIEKNYPQTVQPHLKKAPFLFAIDWVNVEKMTPDSVFQNIPLFKNTLCWRFKVFWTPKREQVTQRKTTLRAILQTLYVI